MPAHQDFLDKGDRTHSPLYKGKVSPKCNLPCGPRDETRGEVFLLLLEEEEEEEGKEIRGSADERTDIKEDNLELHQEISRLSDFSEILAKNLWYPRLRVAVKIQIKNVV